MSDEREDQVLDGMEDEVKTSEDDLDSFSEPEDTNESHGEDLVEDEEIDSADEVADEADLGKGAGDADSPKKPTGKRYTQLAERTRCRFTRSGVKRIDYKDVVTLQKLMTAQGKILSRKRAGIAARYQRMIKVAIKRARFMALLPYTG